MGAPVVHGDRTAAKRLRRDELEPPRAWQPALVQGRTVARDPLSVVEAAVEGDVDAEGQKSHAASLLPSQRALETSMAKWSNV